MKPLPGAVHRRIRRVITWCAAIGFVATAIVAYRWAEPSPRSLMNAHSPVGANASVQLINTPFAGYVDGFRAWSIHAGQVDVLRLPNSALTSIQSAQVVEIRDGNLYDPPTISAQTARNTGPRIMAAGAIDTDKRRIAATFRADQGRYSLGALQMAPPDLEMMYTVQWQFRLMGNVVFKTRAKDELTAPSMTVYSLINRKTGRSEQRIQCEEGAKMTHLGIQVTANTMRFSPKDRMVECLTGVRGTFKQGNVQAERVYWSLNNEVLRCPESASGVVHGMPFTADGLTLDVKRRKHHADHIHIVVDRSSLVTQ